MLTRRGVVRAQIQPSELERTGGQGRTGGQELTGGQERTDERAVDHAVTTLASSLALFYLHSAMMSEDIQNCRTLTSYRRRLPEW